MNVPGFTAEVTSDDTVHGDRLREYDSVVDQVVIPQLPNSRCEASLAVKRLVCGIGSVSNCISAAVWALGDCVR